jgi:hypothetical protein
MENYMDNKDQVLMEQIYSGINENMFTRGVMRTKGGLGSFGQRIVQGAKGFVGKKTDPDAIIKSKVSGQISGILSRFIYDLTVIHGDDLAASDIGRAYPGVSMALEELKKEAKKEKLIS